MNNEQLLNETSSDEAEICYIEEDGTVICQDCMEEENAAGCSRENEKENMLSETTVTNYCNSELSFKWSNEAVILLIDEYRRKLNYFTSGKMSHKKIWAAISKILIQKGYNVSGPQCISKFAGLKRTYKATRDHNAQSGNNRRTWVYYDLMDDLLGRKPFMQPVATISSSSGMHVACKRSLSASEDSDSCDVNNEKHKHKPKKSNKASSTNTQELQKLMEIREENKERRHQEKLKQRAAALEVMKQIALSLAKE